MFILPLRLRSAIRLYYTITRAVLLYSVGRTTIKRLHVPPTIVSPTDIILTVGCCAAECVYSIEKKKKTFNYFPQFLF